MHVFTRKMRDATGKVATHRTNSNTPSKATGHIEPPALPHPDEILTVRWSGYFIPSSSTRPIAEIAAYYAAHPDSEGHPVSGDECARVRYSQCGDPDPDQPPAAAARSTARPRPTRAAPAGSTDAPPATVTSPTSSTPAAPPRSLPRTRPHQRQRAPRLRCSWPCSSSS